MYFGHRKVQITTVPLSAIYTSAIAAFTHPEFKNRWLSCIPREYHDKLLNVLKDIVTAEITRRSIEKMRIPKAIWVKKTLPNSSYSSEAEVEIANFFNVRRNTLQMLNNYEPIKGIFIKFNTSLPSSAPEERLFNHATTMMNLPKSNRLSDQKFEQWIILRANVHLLS
ncbi:uncharacterized protein LOC111619323 [Centruroides sculpturatus]|uniref:uncharacterized protein LOC111619323 n=1 Tax=Centruroides sculpturatus TaxID=218467 RepID=UPI000C6D752B|nr:uncharacterized protein LOC111619323 [Centruroides sculpturatus]